MNVTDFESGAVTGKTAGAEGGKSSLMGKFCKGIGLVHELGQRRRTEELFNSRHNRADVYKRRGRDLIGFLRLQSHTLFDHALHTGEADTELILEQFADGTDTTVAEVVDVVGGADAVRDAVQIVNRRENVVNRDVLRNQVVAARRQFFQKQIFVVAAFVKDFAEHFKADFFVDADFFELIFRKHRDIFADVDHAVGIDFDFVALVVENNDVNALLLNAVGKLFCNHFPFVGENFARKVADNRFFCAEAGDSAGDAELFIIFVSAHAGKVITVGVKEQAVEVRLRGLKCRRFARTKTFINFDKRLFGVDCSILFEGCLDSFVIAEKIEDFLVGAQAQSTDKCRNVDFAVFVDADIKQIVLIGFIFEPGAAVRNDRGGIQLFTGLVMRHTIIDARRTDQLGDNHALRTVNDERTAVSHQREVAHVHFVFFDFARFLIQQPSGDAQRRRIGNITFLALFYCVFRGVIHSVTDEAQHKVAGIVRNVGDIAEHFFQALVEKPLV